MRCSQSFDSCHEIIVSWGLDCAEVEVGEVVLLHVLIQYFKLEKMAVEL
jgi:hypothetical protein